MATEYDLTKDEKVSIIVTHLKNLSSQKYNYEISLAEENSLSEPSEDILYNLNSQHSSVNTKINALEAKLAEVLGE